MVRAQPPKKFKSFHHREPRDRPSSVGRGTHPIEATATAMFKPRLRITRRTGLLRPSSTSTSQNLPASPFAIAAPAAAQQRSTHSIPPLNDSGKFTEQGIQGLYSAHGYNSAYTTYQGWCVEHLNRLTEGRFSCSRTINQASPRWKTEGHDSGPY